MPLLFDTSIIIDIENEDKFVLKKIADLSKSYTGPPQISFVTYFEFLIGIKKRQIKNQNRSLNLLGNLNCLAATKETSEIMVELRYKYESKGISINFADLIIASQAKENNLVLVTRDRVFEKIDEISKIII